MNDLKMLFINTVEYYPSIKTSTEVEDNVLSKTSLEQNGKYHRSHSHVECKDTDLEIESRTANTGG